MAKELVGVMDAERLAVEESVRGVAADISDDDLLQIPGTGCIDVVDADSQAANCCGKRRDGLKI